MDRDCCNGKLGKQPSKTRNELEYWETVFHVKLDCLHSMMRITRQCDSGNSRFVKYAIMLSDVCQVRDELIEKKLEVIRKDHGITLTHKQLKQ